jgi:hypothetical protein
LDTARSVGDMSALNTVTAPAPSDSNGLGHQAVTAMPVSATYLSPSQTYALSLFKLPDQDRCVYTVNNSLGKPVDISSLMGVASIPCQVTGSGLSSGFQTWLDDSTFVIDVGQKILQINVANKTVK